MSREVPNPESVFAEIIEIESPEKRAAFLDQACCNDPEFRREMEKLVFDHFRAGQFLESPARHFVAAVEQLCAERPGTLIGPYKLIEQIGEGGFGVVFMAEQREPVRRLVALKVIKPGMDSKQVVARFEAERQALAMMDHPNIAKILDAGTTGRPHAPREEFPHAEREVYPGRPYFVMELVRGIPITDYCDQAGFSVRQRLQLFVQVCRAVQHAHTKGVIHRDLKPGNVLVTSHDGVPMPFVIDFGVAKALGQQLTERTVYTGFAQLIGTPLYMSPEQAELNKQGVDTRSDIYSLGVLLYELLTGATPFDKERLRTVDFDEMRRIIREEVPPRPSTRLSTLGAALSTVSERRGIDPRKLTQTVQGELDWIVLKALEKDRNRRYESASAFAADVERYLNDEPVEACPPSAGYRLRKYIRRNGRVLVPLAVIAIVLVAATAVSTWQAVEANAARRLADERLENEKKAKAEASTDAAIARAVYDFLHNDLFRQAYSAPQLSDEFGWNSLLTVKEALDRAADSIDKRFRDQPVVEAAIRMAIGEAYHFYHGQLRRGHFERALVLRQAHLGPDHPDTLASISRLADVSSTILSHSADAIALHQRLVEVRRRMLGPDHPETLAAMGHLAGAYFNGRQWDTSVLLYTQLLEKQRTIFGPTHPATFGTMHWLAMSYAHLGRFPESLALYEKLLEGLQSNNGRDHESTTWPMMTFAQACLRAGKLDRAEQLLREVIEQQRKREPARVDRFQRSNTRGWLALNMYLKQRYIEAEALIRETLAFHQKELPESTRTFYWVNLLGAVLVGQQRYAEAEPLVLQGYEGMKQGETTQYCDKWELTEACERVVRFYDVTNQPEKARAWREKLEPTLPGAASAGVR